MLSLITPYEFNLHTQTEFSISYTKLSTATAKVQDYCGTDFGVQTITREKRHSKMTLDQDLHVDFWIKPIVSVSRIALAWGADEDNETELTLSCMDLFELEGYALIPFAEMRACVGRTNLSSTGVGWMRMGDEYITVSDYVGGAAVPDPVKEAIALLAWEDHLVKDKIGDSGDPTAGVIKSYSIGQYSETKGATYKGGVELPGTLGWGTPLSAEAEKLLMSYVQAGSAGVL